MSCCDCGGYETTFDARLATQELKRYRRKGPIRTTRLLPDPLRSQGVEGMTLLHVGGGIGAVHHEPPAPGARAAVHVDAAARYLEAAREGAARRGHAGRVQFLHGDF